METASQGHRNIFATLSLADEFSMRSFIDSPCENWDWRVGRRLWGRSAPLLFCVSGKLQSVAFTQKAAPRRCATNWSLSYIPPCTLPRSGD